MGLDARRPVLVVFDKTKLKPVTSAIGTSKKIENSLVACLDMIISNKQITKALIRLRGCAGWSAPLLFKKPTKTGFLARRPIMFGGIESSYELRRLVSVFAGRLRDKSQNLKRWSKFYHFKKKWRNGFIIFLRKAFFILGTVQCSPFITHLIITQIWM